MRSLINIGLGLSVIFTCLLLALVAEIYYLLWWKRRNIIGRNITIEDDHTTNSSTKSSYMLLCGKNQATSAVNISANTHAHPTPTLHQENKPFEGQNGNFNSGLAPRFLSTIKEETMEEIMESSSEEGKVTGETKSSRQSLSKLMESSIIDIITPYATPLSSPPFLTPCSSNSGSFGGYNPFEECSNDAEFSRVYRSSSPPPKFKFLRNAEEKLVRKTMLIEQVKRESDLGKSNEEGVNGSFITIIVAKNKEINGELNCNYHSPLYHCTSSSSYSSIR